MNICPRVSWHNRDCVPPITLNRWGWLSVALNDSDINQE